MEKIKIYENFLDEVECKSLLHFSEENPSLYETNCKEELKRAKKYIKKQADIIFALEKEIEEKENEIRVLKNG